jgi:Flp pilus assembly protein TadD
MFDSQLKKNPSDPLALAGKAQALQRAGRVDEALRTYDRLLQLNPRDLEALTNSLGLVQQQNPQKALTKLQSLVQQYPDNAAVAGQLATTQARMMDTPNALRNFQKAMALDPTNPTYPFNMAVLYDRLGSSTKRAQPIARHWMCGCKRLSGQSVERAAAGHPRPHGVDEQLG